MSGPDYSQLSMLELFKLEAETQTQVLTADLLALEREPRAPALLESCMRAAHSLKGAARIVGLNPGVCVTHAMEDCFVAAQQHELELGKAQIDLLLGGVDLLSQLANSTEAQLAAWGEVNPPEVDAFVLALARLLGEAVITPEASPAPAAVLAPTAILDPLPPESSPEDPAAISAEPEATRTGARTEGADRVLRVTAQNFNRLLGLAAQSLVESRWLGPFQSSMYRLRRLQDDSVKSLDLLRAALPASVAGERAGRALSNARESLLACRAALAERLTELEAHDRRVTSISRRLYDEALSCRMRPFSDGVQAFPRMLRDLAQTLGKRARLEIAGESTPVDRDVLAKLEAPLTHLLRNAVDHGIDRQDARAAAGKPLEGVVRLEARHLAGMLQVSVADDGEGIDIERVRRVIIARRLIDQKTAEQLSEAEVYEFLFLPGFSLREEVTEISGRGVGLDAVQSAVKQLRGSVRASSRPGQGALFQLLLPLTVSVVRSLVVEIGGAPYAFPLAHIERALTLDAKDVQSLEGRQHFTYDARQIGLVTAHQIFCEGELETSGQSLPVILLAERGNTYGLVVDRLIGARELVVQALDARLGKIKDIAAGALLEDGAPVLIVDVEDLVRSIEKLISGGQLTGLRYGQADRELRRKRVLVVDDSFTVRELERKLIDSGGYEVEVAVDGMDGWNAVRVGAFDLVVTDIDMPRMDGVDLVKLIRKDARLRTLPVMIVSYKDREADRQRGLDAGADFYLAKANFKNEGLLQAVVDLIGEANA
jgi:two-component system, chemotaxis family, sensor histidine kinase and response regulator WspE